MSRRLPLLFTLLLTSLPFNSGVAQAFAPSTGELSLASPVLVRDAGLVPAPMRYSPPPYRSSPLLPSDSARDRHWHRGIIGGLVGLVAGVAACNLLSNALFNEGPGTSGCTTRGNLAFGGSGFALGFMIGWLTTPAGPTPN